MRVCRQTRECRGPGPTRHVVRPWPIKVKVSANSSLYYSWHRADAGKSGLGRGIVGSSVVLGGNELLTSN